MRYFKTEKKFSPFITEVVAICAKFGIPGTQSAYPRAKSKYPNAFIMRREKLRGHFWLVNEKWELSRKIDSNFAKITIFFQFAGNIHHRVYFPSAVTMIIRERRDIMSKIGFSISIK